MGAEAPGAFAALLRRLRQSAALSQEELAERAGLTAKAIGALERGERRRPYPNTVRALADALELGEGDRLALAEAAHARPAAPEDDPPAPAPAPPPAISRSSIPVPPTPLIGRDREVVELVAILRSGSARLVTITGPGGVGKTRLAWAVARALGDDGGPAAVVAELASVTAVDLVLPTVARAIGLQAATGDVAAAIAAFLGDHRQVLVLDNLEHLLAAAPAVADLLARCEGLVILATSRAPLRIRAEQDHPLAPLAVPDVRDGRVITSAAVELFADRARAVVPGFTVDRHTASAVAAICRRLEGLPLAIELAASHVRYLAPAQLLDRLDEALGSARLRDLPARQRTMGATLDWSYQLLTADEQALLRALSVFRGSFDLDAVEAVTSDSPAVPDAGSGGAVMAGGVMAALDGLVEQSLVVRVATSDPHAARGHRLLEPVRRYAAALLDDDETARMAHRHARHHARLGRAARAGLRGHEQKAWLDRLHGGHDNLRAALRTLIAGGDLDDAATLGADTWLYWALRGHAGEGLRWWEEVLQSGEAGSGELRPGGGGALSRRGRAAARIALAGLGLATGDIASVRAKGAQAVPDARASDDPELLVDALGLWCMGLVFAGELGEAAEPLEELLALTDAIDDTWMRAHAWTIRSQLLLLQGDLDRSATALDAAEETARTPVLPFTLATVLNMRATVALHAGDDEAALRHLVESTRLAADVGTTWTLVYSLPALAVLAARRGDPSLAATLFAAGEATAEASLLTVSFRPDAETADAQMDAVRRRLTDEELGRAWSSGRSLRIEDVLDLIPRISGHPGRG